MADLDAIIADALIDPTQVSNQDNWRYKVLLAIADVEPSGATDNELTDLLRPPGGQNNIRPRRGELVDRGYLTDSGLKRQTSSGSQATVWRLSSRERPILTPQFGTADCEVAGKVAEAASGGPSLSQADRDAGRKLRARFALLGRRARRASLDNGLVAEADIDASGAISVALWTGSDRSRFEVVIRLDASGLRVDLVLGGADPADAQATARTEHFRGELLALPAETLAPLSDLASGEWDLKASGGGGATETAPTSVEEWLQTLFANPTLNGRLARTIDPQSLDALGTDVTAPVVDLTRAALPIGAAAEAAMSDPVQALVRGLLWDEARARKLIALANRSRQLLFAGPPGTGKTLAARILAKALADESRVRLVQFHPTYAYEDFVEGIRPVVDEDTGESPSTDGVDEEAASAVSGLRYEIRPGVFKKLVKSAQEAPSTARHFLIIDEMNRANLPRVLGELLFALEYRGPENRVELAYSADDFFVPENVWIVGTMNTADRSVSLLDAAMRRRFKEVRFDVDYEVIKTWHERNTSTELGTEAAARLKRLNAEVVDLLDDDRAVGHSFLIRNDLAEVGFETVWSEDLEPVLRDHLLGRTDDLPALREAFLGTL